MIDFHDIPEEYLLNPSQMLALINESLKLTDCNICDELKIIYPNKEGYTILFLLSESHLSVHSMPKTNSFSLDFYNVKISNSFFSVAGIHGII